MRIKLLIASALLFITFVFSVSNTRVTFATPRTTGYEISWNTMDGGGGTSTGGAYSLSGTIGQADAGTLNGASYKLNGGFWVDFLGNKIILPLILR